MNNPVHNFKTQNVKYIKFVSSHVTIPMSMYKLQYKQFFIFIL